MCDCSLDSSNMSNQDIVCPECLKKATVKHLILVQMTTTTALYMCPDKNCPYPVDDELIAVPRTLEQMAKTMEKPDIDKKIAEWEREAEHLYPDPNMSDTNPVFVESKSQLTSNSTENCPQNYSLKGVHDLIKEFDELMENNPSAFDYAP